MSFTFNLLINKGEWLRLLFAHITASKNSLIRLDEAKPGSASTTGYQRLCPKKSTTETAIARHKHIFIQERQFLIGACRNLHLCSGHQQLM